MFKYRIVPHKGDSGTKYWELQRKDGYFSSWRYVDLYQFDKKDQAKADVEFMNQKPEYL